MRFVNIPTTQQVTISYPLASLGERILAFLVDLILIVLSYLLLVLLLSILVVGGGSLIPTSVLIFFLPIFYFILYFFTSELWLHGQTIGKRIVGLRVVRIDGQDPVPADYLLRAVLQLVDTLFTGGVAAVFIILATTNRQRLGDLAANTCIIRTRTSTPYALSDILRITTNEEYQPTYPAIRQLTEQDMLLVKQVLMRYRSYPNAAHSRLLQQTVDRIQETTGIALPAAVTPTDFLDTLIRDYIVLTR